MTREPLITVPIGTTLEDAREILHQHKVEKLLVVDRNFRLKGLIQVERGPGAAGCGAVIEPSDRTVAVSSACDVKPESPLNRQIAPS